MQANIGNYFFVVIGFGCGSLLYVKWMENCEKKMKLTVDKFSIVVYNAIC
jgi:hypothetical protein